MKNLAIFVFTSILVSSCAVGVRYSPPKDGEPYAFISGDYSTIYTLNEDGCRASYSFIKNGIKIQPGVPAFIDYREKIGSNNYCSMLLSFTPEAGATYKVQASLERSEKEKASIFIPIFKGAMCIAGVIKIESDGSKVPVKVEKVTQKQTCKSAN